MMISRLSRKRRQDLALPALIWVSVLFALTTFRLHRDLIQLGEHLENVISVPDINTSPLLRVGGARSILMFQEEEREKAAALAAAPEAKKTMLSLSKEQPNLTSRSESLFYQDHAQRITTLVNSSSALVWQTTMMNLSYNFLPFRDHFPSLYKVPMNLQRDYNPFRLLHENPNFQFPSILEWHSICHVSQAFSKFYNHSKPPPPHVLILDLDENWGAFSAPIPGKTSNWDHDLDYKWKQEGCSRADILSYLDQPMVRAVVTTQFQRINHPKVHSLPLGIRCKENIKAILKRLKDDIATPHERPNWLMINSKPRPMRKAPIAAVIDNFHGTVQNTYQPPKMANYEDYLTELGRAKFILSPGGWGLDCYRHWEALYMGTIPVLEHLNRTDEDGWYRSLDGLPVAWIDSYEHLTPEWLQAEHARLVAQAHSLNYEKLTKQWWIDMIQSSLLSDPVIAS